MLRTWMKRLPEPVVITHPVTCSYHVMLKAMAGDFQSVALLFQDRFDGNPTVEGFRSLLQGYRYFYREGAFHRCIEEIPRMLAVMPASHGFAREMGELILCLALRYAGQVEAAFNRMQFPMEEGFVPPLKAIGYVDVLLGMGRLHRAFNYINQCIDAGRKRFGDNLLPEYAYLYVQQGSMLYEKNRIDEALEACRKGLYLGRNNEYIEFVFVGNMEYAKVLMAAGEVAEANKAINRSVAAARSSATWGEHLALACKARMEITKGNLARAQAILSEMGDFSPMTMSFYTQVRRILGDPSYEGVLEFHPVGKPVLMDFFSTAVLDDLGRIMGVVFLLIIAMLFLLFRSFSAVVWPSVLIVAGLVWVFGMIGWSGITMSIMVQIITFLMISVGVCDAVHILSGYLYMRNSGVAHTNALKRVMKQSGVACFLTSLTTAVGLLSLCLVPVKPIAVFGLFSAIGVLTAFLLTMMLMPLMLDLWAPFRPKKRSKAGPIGTFIEKIGGLGLNHPVKVMGLFGAATLVFLYGVFQMRVDSNDMEVLKKGLPLRASYGLVNRFMGGSGNLEISLDFHHENALKDPRVLNAMESLHAYLASDDHIVRVVKSLSLVNAVKEANKALHNGNERFYTIPQDPEALAQTLFLFENANPKDRRRLVTDDYQKARMGIHSENAGSSACLAFMDTVQTYMDRHFGELTAVYPGMEVTMTGHMALLAAMLETISWSQIKSFGMTLIVISLVVFLVFGNVRVGILAMIPNVFPILVTFGTMGYWGIPLDMDTLLIAPIIIGLAVDDTIHFLTHYRFGVARFGNARQAAVHALKEAGQAISFTSLVLAAGFSMFVLSFHNGLSHFGILSALAIATACVTDLCLLPALCTWFQVDFATQTMPAGQEPRINLG